MKTRIKKKVAFSFDDNFFLLLFEFGQTIFCSNHLLVSHTTKRKKISFIKKNLEKIIGEVQARIQLLSIPTRNSCISPTHMSIQKYTKFIKKKN